MLTPTGKDLETLAKSLGWNDDFGVMQQRLLENGLPQMLAIASREMKAAESARDKLLDCGAAKADPGCQVPQRFLFQVARGKPKEVVFAQILSGFLMAGAEPNIVPPADPHIVGLNLVMPEDWYVPIRIFHFTCACSTTCTRSIPARAHRVACGGISGRVGSS